MANFFLLNLLFFLSLPLYAGDFYSEHEQGWFWFDDPKVSQSNSKKRTEEKSKETDPEEVVKAAKKKLKKALDQAIIDPTEKNVERYIALQNEMSERANRFANVWQQVIHGHPELNYGLAHPTNNAALKVYHETQSRKKIEVIREFARHSGLFFFYRSTCPYCQRFSPILKHFAETYGISVIPITLNRQSLPEFPHSREDQGQSKEFHVSVEPSLYAVNPNTQKAFPVAFGLTSESELLDNLYNILTHYQAGLS